MTLWQRIIARLNPVKVGNGLWTYDGEWHPVAIDPNKGSEVWEAEVSGFVPKHVADYNAQLNESCLIAHAIAHVIGRQSQLYVPAGYVQVHSVLPDSTQESGQ